MIRTVRAQELKVVLFDIDGTLVRTNGAGMHAIQRTLAEEFGVSEPNADVSYAGRTDRSLVREIFLLNGLAVDEPSIVRFFTAYVTRLKSCLVERKGRVLPGVVATLDRLAADERAVVGLLTGNIRDGAFEKLAHYELSHYFAHGGFGDFAESRDDIAREGLSAVEAHLGVRLDPRQVLVIGDTPHDVTCARAIGARVLALATGYSPREELVRAKPDYLLDDLSDQDAVGRILDDLGSV